MRHLEMPTVLGDALNPDNLKSDGNNRCLCGLRHHNRRLTVAEQRTERTHWKPHFETAIVASPKPKHLGDGRGQRGHASTHQWVTKAEQSIAFDARDCSEGHRADVTAHQLHTQGSAVHEPTRCVRFIGTGSAGLQRLKTQRAKQSFGNLQAKCGRATEQQGCFHGPYIPKIAQGR